MLSIFSVLWIIMFLRARWCWKRRALAMCLVKISMFFLFTASSIFAGSLARWTISWTRMPKNLRRDTALVRFVANFVTSKVALSQKSFYKPLEFDGSKKSIVSGSDSFFLFGFEKSSFRFRYSRSCFGSGSDFWTILKKFGRRIYFSFTMLISVVFIYMFFCLLFYYYGS